MRTFLDWFRNESIDQSDPWLIFGKGPSFAERHRYDLSRFHTMSLNHAVREHSVKVAHIIDLDVLDHCAEAITNKAEVLVLPWRPHVNFLPSPLTLELLAQQNDTLRLLDEQGRLLWYNLYTAHDQQGDSPVIHAEFFSAEAGLDLLAHAGVRQIRSLGVDGGASYSAEFDDLNNTTLLSCGHATFDKQFKGFARTISKTGVDYAPLNIEAPIRVYVGATEAQMIPYKVLEHSIQKHASMTVQVSPLHEAQIDIPPPMATQNRPRTPFSFQRFLIPALVQYRGKAIYLDSDMIVFDDIRKLWLSPFDGADLLTAPSSGSANDPPQFSVMLLNCQTLKWNISEIVDALDAGTLNYERLMFDMDVGAKVKASIDASWNSLEHFSKQRTRILHYTNMATQPWLSRTNRLNQLWMSELFDAIDHGHISLSEIEEHARRGYVRPSLLYQVNSRISDSRHLDKRAAELDRWFVPPGTCAQPKADIARRGVRKLFSLLSNHRLQNR